MDRLMYYALLPVLFALVACEQPNDPAGGNLGSLSGLVLDAATELPIVGAEVRALVNNVADTTDSLGMFLLDDLEPGADTLMITGMRIDTLFKQISILPDEQEITVSANSKLVGEIVFSSNRTGEYEIYMMDLDGGNLIQLTDNNYVKPIIPKFSPDGSKIYFDAPNADYSHDIIIMNRDGTDLNNLTESPETETDPFMSPDGQHIVYSTRSLSTFQSEVTIMNNDGSNKRVLTSNFYGARAYDYSPSGDYILCFGSESLAAGQNLFLVPVDGSPATKLAGAYDATVGIDYIRYSPDGQQIAFSIYAQEYDLYTGQKIYSNIFIMEANGTNLVQLTSNEQYSWCIGFSPDGLEILYNEGQGSSRIPDLLVMGTDGTNIRNLTNSVANEGTGLFIDPSHIIYEAKYGATGENWNYDIYLIDEIEGTITRLTQNPADDRHPVVFLR